MSIDIGSKLSGLFLSYNCLLCRLASDQPYDLCRYCESSLPYVQNACKCCGNVFPPGLEFIDRCGACLNHPPYFDSLQSCFTYHSPIDRLLIAAKFQVKWFYLNVLGRLFAQKMIQAYSDKPWPTHLLAVPLHPKRERSRGYNQALILAKVLSKELGIPLLKGYCQRIKPTQPQSELGLKDRQANVSKAFQLKRRIPAKHIALIDDIVTTGATVNSLSQLLKKEGVERIDIWCLAKTQIRQ